MSDKNTAPSINEPMSELTEDQRDLRAFSRLATGAGIGVAATTVAELGHIAETTLHQQPFDYRAAGALALTGAAFATATALKSRARHRIQATPIESYEYQQPPQPGQIA